ncbi:MAG: hypothetical protein IJY89_02920, partial [Clostridia bacterium]|nr:hypothetical protein [Clostridia bacterium]
MRKQTNVKSPAHAKAAIVLVLVGVTMLCSFFSFSSMAGWQDFATPLLSLEAEQATVGPHADVRGQKVGNMGQWSGKEEGYVLFENLDLQADGEYLVRVHYMSGSDDRYYILAAAGTETKLPCPNTGSFDTVGSVIIPLQLEAGGTLRVGSDYYAPDLDKVEIFEKDALIFPERSYVDGENVTLKDRLVLDTKNG